MSSLHRVRVTAGLPPRSPLPSSKKRKRQDNPGTDPPIPPDLTPNNCVLCRNNIGDACRSCEALLIANEQLPDEEIRDIICHAVECRECGRRFHYHCIARWVMWYLRNICPVMVGRLHRCILRQQQDGVGIERFYLDV